MNFIDLAKARYSVRNFSNKPIEQEKLDIILHAAQIAPTATNAQPFKIYVVGSAEALAKMRTLTKCHYNAPVILMITYNQEQEWQNPLEAGITAGRQDTSIVATHIMLAATEQGLGTCWVNFFAPSEVQMAFSLPENEIPALLMPIGYPAADALPSARHTQSKPLKDLVTYL